MNEDNSFKKYLLFIICSVLIIGAATFYFYVTDKKEEPVTIVINKNEQETGSETFLTTTSKISTQKNTKKASKTSSKSIITTQTTQTETLYIDINSAGTDELKKLKGIGEVLAEEIVNYRNNFGSFRNIEEIMNVSGIGERIFANIKDNIYVVDPIYDTNDETDTNEENEENFEIPETPQEDDEQTIESPPTLEDAMPININTADAETLMLLPYVDEDIAEKKIDFRIKSNNFKNEYELLLIDGLSKNQVSEILPYITIE